MDDLLGKVVCGLESCTRGNGICQGVHCPYHISRDEARLCRINLLFDVCSLLQIDANAPRVMTLTEAFDAEVAWLERYANPDDGVEPIIQPVIIRYYENGYWQCLIEQDESADLSLFLDGFGTEFRFWTSRPTDEQREATPWE